MIEIHFHRYCFLRRYLNKFKNTADDILLRIALSLNAIINPLFGAVHKASLFVLLLATLAVAMQAYAKETNVEKSSYIDKGKASSQVIKVAVAANFTNTLNAVIQHYQKQHPNVQFKISSASTGVLYNQIVNGAPYDMFFSADWQRPDKLVKQGIGHKHRSAVYAIGQLSFWSPKISEKNLATALTALTQIKQQRLAIANPEVAPFGKGAMQAIKRAGFISAVNERIVKGNNVSQAFQFVQAGAATAAIVATSLVQQERLKKQSFQLPDNLYSPIKQQMLVIQELPHVMAFYQFILSPAARSIIAENGYALPSAADVKLML